MAERLFAPHRLFHEVRYCETVRKVEAYLAQENNLEHNFFTISEPNNLQQKLFPGNVLSKPSMPSPA
jgi:hypothetical protein